MSTSWRHEARFEFSDSTLNDFPALPAELNRAQRAILKDRLARRWPAVLAPEVAEFVSAVSARSAALINQTLATKRDRERFYWRLLRIHSAPYFILGCSTVRTGSALCSDPLGFSQTLRVRWARGPFRKCRSAPSPVAGVLH
jgi:hypothetical protein